MRQRLPDWVRARLSDSARVRLVALLVALGIGVVAAGLALEWSWP